MSIISETNDVKDFIDKLTASGVALTSVTSDTNLTEIAPHNMGLNVYSVDKTLTVGMLFILDCT